MQSSNPIHGGTRIKQQQHNQNTSTTDDPPNSKKLRKLHELNRLWTYLAFGLLRRTVRGVSTGGVPPLFRHSISSAMLKYWSANHSRDTATTGPK